MFAFISPLRFISQILKFCWAQVISRRNIPQSPVIPKNIVGTCQILHFEKRTCGAFERDNIAVGPFDRPVFGRLRSQDLLFRPRDLRNTCPLLGIGHLTPTLSSNCGLDFLGNLNKLANQDAAYTSSHNHSLKCTHKRLWHR
jgi:hypothetical protein